MSYYRNQLEAWLKQINVKTNFVLDIGGGEKPIKDRVASWEVEKYEILDNDAQFNPQLFADLNHPLGIDLAYFNSVDTIFCLEVFEYIWNPVQAMKNIYELLKEDGVAYVSFPTIYPLHNPVGIDYLRYSKNAIEKLLAETGFKTWEITPRIATDGVNALRDFYTLEGMHPMRNTREIFDIGYCVKIIK